MIVVKEKSKRLEAQSGLYNVYSCAFDNLIDFEIFGGCIFADVAAYLTINECLFSSCAAKTGGSIYSTSKVITINLIKICGFNCTHSPEQYGIFGRIASQRTVVADMYTTCYNRGSWATTRFESGHEILTNINSTHNVLYKEAAFLVYCSNFCTCKFIQACSNVFTSYGINYYRIYTTYISYCNYFNCTASDHVHIQIHLSYTSTILDNCYIYVVGSNENAITLVDSVGVSIENSVFVDSNKISGNITMGSGIKYGKKDMSVFYLFNTVQCPTDKRRICSVLMKRSNNNFLILFQLIFVS